MVLSGSEWSILHGGTLLPSFTATECHVVPTHGKTERGDGADRLCGERGDGMIRPRNGNCGMGGWLGGKRNERKAIIYCMFDIDIFFFFLGKKLNFY